MTDVSPPEFRELSRAEIDDVLTGNDVGRVAYSIHDRIDIEPIHYVYDDGWIFGRTSQGEKLRVLAHRPWVAFEVDEVSSPLDWRSVVVHGSFHHLDADGSEIEQRTYRRALAALRSQYPATLTDRDPVPSRSELFGIHVSEVTGRSSTWKSGAPTSG
jgi:nitroimidazol reductase NimA-like FMN-containing flavoprotein (pyridoxamine 5'-phosphate oxidase superfamily)